MGKSAKSSNKIHKTATLNRSPAPPLKSVSLSSAKKTEKTASQPSHQPSSKSNLSQLQQKFKDKLDGARFRSLNEKLYTCRGEAAFEEFQSQPELFILYHEGYKKQVSFIF